MRIVLRLAVTAASLLAAAPTLSAQCTALPNTGCPTSLPITCSGSSQIGQRIAFDCPNNGRAFAQFLLVGVCETIPAPIVPPFACVPGPCGLGVQLGTMVAVPTGFSTVGVNIPPDPTLIGQSLCVQCADLIARTPMPCLDLSGAGQVTFF